ncbi:hypothetical protein [Chitinophaga sp. LS1]|uniref:phosphatase domain-containing putative toxin n=1 Tax=Chitinophaga sp. LS1 TaxID=3051176 RepID=UPI002AABBCB8|nr:hypothetical protein [Chitinophaga sp. LS1]WPV70276.1 hypothetical protein QQL36_16335 [Chitinophaga sp. LS1]
MSTKIYWITDTIGIMPRPRGNEWLEDEIIAFKKQGVDIIVSLLEQSEITELGLRQEKLLCEKHSIQFINFPIPDRSLPPKGRQTEAFIQTLTIPSKIVIHCRMGIGRSSIIAACILLYQNKNLHEKGNSPTDMKTIFRKKATEIISHISHIRGLKVPDTEEQFQWLKEREQLLYKPVHHLIQRQSLHNDRENNNDITSG